MILDDIFHLRRLCQIYGMDAKRFGVYLTREDASKLCTGQPLDFPRETIYDFKIISTHASKTRIEILAPGSV